MQPNIILITADQFRGDCLGLAGHPELRTPWLDHMATRGVHFRRAHSSCPVCIPARRSLLTGLHPSSHGLCRNVEGQRFDPPATLPGLLREQGYQTQLIGKFHVSTPGHRLGFDNIIQSETPNDRRESTHQRRNDYADWYHQVSSAPHTLYQGIMSNDRSSRPWTEPEWHHHTNWVTTEAARFLGTTRDPECPFFLNLSYWAPHQPALPPQAYFDRYRDNSWSPAIGDWVDARPVTPGLKLDAQRGPFSQRDMREHAAGYYGLINHIDDQLNFLFSHWGGSRLAEKQRPTWIIFTSDHGEQLGEHHLFRKQTPYEGSTHIPLFIAPLTGPVDGPRQSDALVGLEDILPTCLELAGAPPATHLGASDGRSLAGTLTGQAFVREHFHGECVWRGQGHHRSCISGQHVYIRWTQTGEEQCFDLVADPQQLHDCSGIMDLAPFRALVDAHRYGAATADRDGRVSLRPCAGKPPQAIWG